MDRTLAEDSIAAISTPLGEGGIGIVRVSGPRAIPIVKEIFVSSKGRDLATDSRPVLYGAIVDERGQVVDEALVHRMRAPHSYTCEDVVEINCHGGVAPLNAVLELVLRRGARLAEPGEFTKRAFLNGRIDLAQAEAVMDVIQARTRASLRAAASTAGGALSRSIHELSQVLVSALAHIEAAVDFPEEDLPDLVNAELRTRLDGARGRMAELLATSEAGRLYREGAAMAIAGRPNVGKSSLFNALLRDVRAIVTAQPGTTRDRIEELITIAGVPVRLIDTAGMRDAHDEVERIGVELARDSFRQAEIVLFVMDASEPPRDDDRRLCDELEKLDVPTALALNKMDVAQWTTPPGWVGWCAETCPVSAVTGQGMGDLEERLGRMLLGNIHIAPEQGLITRIHQRDSLRRAEAALERVLANFGASPEFLSIDLREAIQALGEITGETTPEAILDRIFAQFCIGK